MKRETNPVMPRAMTPMSIFDSQSSAYETDSWWLREFAKEILSLRRARSILDEIISFYDDGRYNKWDDKSQNEIGNHQGGHASKA